MARPMLSEQLSTARPRLLTTSIRRLAAQPKPRAKPASPARRGPSQPQQQSSYALIRSLAAKPTPTILYEGPSHFWFYFGCWTSGVSILAWTVLTGPTVIDQPEGVPTWVPWVYRASYVLFAGMGFYVLSKTPNIVRSIRVLPSAAAAGPGGAARATPTKTTGGAPSLQMEVTVQRALPFLKPKVVTTGLDGVSLASRLSLPEEFVPRLRREEMERREQQLERQLHKRDMERILTMPFRRLGRGLVRLFRGVRAAWTDMGFGVIRVDGKSYKVDVTQGFAHDGFRTLERIVPIETK